MKNRGFLLAIFPLFFLPFRASPQGETGFLRWRGIATTFPFYVGSSLYGVWEGYREVENKRDWWWFDRKEWERKFREWSELRVNTLVFWHPHPYPALLRLPRFPEAEYFPPQRLNEMIDMFRWITKRAKDYRIEVYLMTWNICLPPGMRKAHNLREFGEDTPLVREYTRYCVKRLFETYPDLAGLITQAGETPPGCVDFVLNSIVKGLNDLKRKPRLIYWNWCSYPEEVERMRKAYKGPFTLMTYLQYEQFFRPMADPRLQRWHRLFKGVPIISLGGPKGANWYLFWGDPFFAKKVVEDSKKKGGEGLLVEAVESHDRWLAKEALLLYSYDQRIGRDYWERRVGETYGLPQAQARNLLSAMIYASGIMPRFVHLVHSQSDHYMPQFGLLLVQILEMPTLTTYVYENHERINEKGYLYPHVGLTFPNPSPEEWGERIVSIKEYVSLLREGKTIRGTTPLQIAEEMERNARACLAIVEEMKTHEESGASLRDLLNRLRLNSYLGLFYGTKIKAGVAWEKWRNGLTGGEEVLKWLEESLRWWEKVVEVANILYPGEVSFTRNEIDIPPPWGHLDIWQSYRRGVRGHWRDNLPLFRREYELIRERVEKREKDLPMWGEVSAPQVKELLLSVDRLEIDSYEMKEEWNIHWRTDPANFPLQPKGRYLAKFDYEVLECEKGALLALAGRTDSGGIEKDAGVARIIPIRKGMKGKKYVLLDLEDYPDYYLFICTRGKAKVLLRDLKVWEVER